jgi:hypothetical protein
MASETQDISRVLGQIEGRLNEHSRRFDDVDARFDRMDARFDQLNNRIDRLMLAVLAFGGGVIAVLLGLLVTLVVQG